MSNLDTSVQGGVTITQRKPQVQPQAPQPDPNAQPPRTLTAEELKKRRLDVSRSMGWGEPPEDPKAQAEPQPEPQPQPAAQAQPEPEPEPEPMDAQTLIRETATAVGREVAKAVRPEPAPQQAEPAPIAEPNFELSPDDQADFELSLFLADQDPQRYANLPAQVLEYFKKLYAYQDKWIADNEGKNFDANADEHEQWFAANSPPISGELLEKARVDREVERRVAQRVQPLEDRITMVDSEKALAAAEPVIKNTLNTWQYNLCRAVDEELSRLLVSPDGKLAMTPENIAKIEQTDPVAKGVLDMMCQTLNPVIYELERTAVPGGRYRLDPANNEIHRFIDNQRKAIEQDLRSSPKDEQMRDGKEWLSLQEMTQRERAIFNSRGTQAQKQVQLDDLHSSYWTVTVDDLEDVITDELARQAKQQIKQIDDIAKRKYGQSGGEPRRETPQPQPEPLREPPPQPRDRFRPPSLSSSSDVVTTPENVRGNAKTKGEVAADVHFK